MKEKAWIFLVIAALALSILAQPAHAGYGPDNPLQPFEGYNPKKSNTAASLVFVPVPTSLGFYDFDKDRSPTVSFSFNATMPANTKASYIYLLTKFYDSDSEAWAVKLNDEYVVLGAHSPSVGGNPKGDGKEDFGEFAEEGEPQFKQAIKLNVTNKLKSGENQLSITGLGWEMISSKNAKTYSLYGIAILNFYQTNKTHEVWAYEGVEYFKRKLVTDDSTYAIALQGATYAATSKADLYVLYHNGNLTQDTLSLNSNLLEDEKAGYYAGSSFISLMKFDVGSYLDKNDNVAFSTEIGDAYAIYPSFVVLDVEIDDKTPPSISITAPKNNSNFLSNETMTITYTADEELSETYVKIGTRTELSNKVGAAYQVKINLSLTGIGNGTKELTVVAKDLAGNEARKSINVNISIPEVIKIIDIGLENLTIEEGSQVKEGKDLHLSVLGTNKGGETAAAEISLYLDNVLVDSQNATLDAFGHRKVDFAINGTKLVKGTREIKAEIKHTSGNFRDNSSADNTINASIVVEEETGGNFSLPPIEKPDVKELDIGISSLTIEEGYEVKEGNDINLNIIGINRGEEKAEVEISVYVDDVLIDSQKTTLDAYGHRKVDFVVKGIRLEKGIKELKARIRHISEGVRDPESGNNEKAVSLVVEEEKTAFSGAIGIGKWVIGIIAGVIVLKLIIDFISERSREDYLK